MKFNKLVIFLLLFSIKTFAQNDKINIVWLMAEDINPHLGCYGEKLVHTPNIDFLAKNGIMFTQAFTVAGVCAPSRAAIITGMHSTAIGTQHMRQAKSHTPYDGIPFYNAVPPPNVKAFTEYLRANDIFCTNNNKTDYQFGTPFTVWDSHSQKATWRDREDKNQAFFSCFTFQTTHEINVWPDVVKSKFYREFKTDTTKLDKDAKYRPYIDNKYIVNPKDIVLPPYYPDDSIVRADVARHYTNISRMDTQVGDILKKLKEDNLDENTIIFFMGDNGDGLPRAKRWMYDSGIKVPLIVYVPDKLKSKIKGFKSGINTDLTSFIDLAPTVLSILDVKIPNHIQGKAFLGNQISTTKNKFIYAARDRMDNRYDIIRAVRDSRYKYIKNFQPDVNYTQQLDFMYMMPMMQRIIQLDSMKKLNQTQSYWLFQKKPVEELYDTQTDPHEIKNLANDKKYEQILLKLRNELKNWQAKNDPYLTVNEQTQANQMWHNLEQPITEKPIFNQKNGKLALNSNTTGASIAYRKKGETRWKLYSKPLEIKDFIEAKAVRYGWKESEISIWSSK
jgi:N-sulfoglucosamine sulfohydrolase